MKAQNLFIFLVCILLSSMTQAKLFRLESETLLSGRAGEDLKAELPLYEFVEAFYSSEKDVFKLSSSFGFFADGMKNKSQFDLYLLDAQYDVVPDVIKINFGRTYNDYSKIKSMMVDSVGAEVYFFEKQIQLGAYAGYEQNFELKKTTNKGFVSGAYTYYRSSTVFPLVVGLRYESHKYQLQNRLDDNLTRFSIYKPFPGFWNPELVFNNDYNSNTRKNIRTEGGLDFYPTTKSSFGVRGLTYEMNSKSGWEDPLSTIFAQGQIREVSFKAGYQFTPIFYSSLSVGYDQYYRSEGYLSSGHRSEWDLRLIDKNYSVDNLFFYIESYGGNVYGNRIYLRYKYNDKSEIDGTFEIATYEKIISSKRSAFSSQIGLGTWAWDAFKFHLAGEYNNNNINQYDVRVLAKLTYFLWKDL